MKTMPFIKRPADVRNAFRLLFGSLILETLGFLLFGTFNWGVMVFLLIGFALTFFLMVKANEGYNWPRLVLTFIIGLGLLTTLVTFPQKYPVNTTETSIDVVSTVMTLIAVILLFSRSSNTWFAQARK